MHDIFAVCYMILLQLWLLFLSFSLADYPVKEPRKMDASLMAVSRFGFMIEQCIVAARHSQPLICPSHSNHPLRIRDVAPDLVKDLEVSVFDSALTGQALTHPKIGKSTPSNKCHWNNQLGFLLVHTYELAGCTAYQMHDLVFTFSCNDGACTFLKIHIFTKYLVFI